MGYIGDLYGRKKALVISIFLMAFPTFFMGCLPSYASVGSLAIVLLIIVRLLQGLSVGGQLMSSLVFTLENHSPSQWGLFGSYVMASANCGTLLGGIVGVVLRSSLTQQQLTSWGWRVCLKKIFSVDSCSSTSQVHRISINRIIFPLLLKLFSSCRSCREFLSVFAVSTSVRMAAITTGIIIATLHTVKRSMIPREARAMRNVPKTEMEAGKTNRLRLHHRDHQRIATQFFSLFRKRIVAR